MTIAGFNELRAILLDSSQAGQNKRKEIINSTELVKGWASVGRGVFVVITVVSCISITSIPLIGILFTLVGTAGTVAAHDMTNIAANTEKMMRNVFHRGVAALSANAFTTRVLRGTWVVGPFYGPILEANLRDA